MGYPKYFEDNERIQSERIYMAEQKTLDSLDRLNKSNREIPGLKGISLASRNNYRPSKKSRMNN